MESNTVETKVNATPGTETTAPTGADLSSGSSSSSTANEVNTDLSDVGKSDGFIWAGIACYLIFYRKGDIATTVGSFILVSLFLNKK